MRDLGRISVTATHGALIGLLAGAVLALGGGPALARGGDPLVRLCDMGVRLALDGRTAAAESTFMALLSRSPRDPRALNNLGNLAMWRNDAVLASACYRAAADADTSDAGIVLNAANALLAAGEESDALHLAEAGVRQAGGVDRAAGLLGLAAPRVDEPSTPAGDRTRLSQEQVLQLLKSARRSIPMDSTVRAVSPADSARTHRAPNWRPAGVRSSDATETSPVVYWKR
jgi:hypothetical protein